MLKILGIVCILFSRVMSQQKSSTNVWESSGQFEGDIKLPEGLGARNVYWSGLWPGGVVPYEIDHQKFNQSDRELIQRAIETIEEVVASRGKHDESCQLKFVPRNQQDQNFINITSLGPLVCWSYIGVKGGPQELSLGPGCMKMHIIIHELLHALGLGHQHSATNRDKFIDIIWENIEPDQENNFETVDPNYFTDYNLPYDFQSIMHYSKFAFAKRNPDGEFVGPTMVPKDHRYELETNAKISQLDETKLLIMYCEEPMQV